MFLLLGSADPNSHTKQSGVPFYFMDGAVLQKRFRLSRLYSALMVPFYALDRDARHAVEHIIYADVIMHPQRCQIQWFLLTC